MKRIVLVRHGESIWNKENKFTGWTDVDLSENGIKEAHDAGILLKTQGFTFDVAYTSELIRANHTLDIILEEMNLDIPIYYSWRLNERHYGALQGLNKKETALKYGDEQVHIWRRSFDTRPPALSDDDERYKSMLSTYPEYLPHTECLKDTVERVIPYFEENIVPDINEGKNVLIVAHGNSLRGLIKYLDNISDEEIVNLEIPTGNPLIYELDDNLLPIRHYYIKKEEDKMEKAKVYFTKEITPESLIKMYEVLGVELPGNVGIKISTGEKGSKNYLKPELIGALVNKLNGTIVECNTAYDGARNTAEDHLQVAKDHGFTEIGQGVEILDGLGEKKIPVKTGKHLKYDIIGEAFDKYDSFINLAHGKGHMMGGFGANLKNQSIGFASRAGKAYIHSVGQTEDADACWQVEYEQKDFIEAMAEAAKAVSDYCKDTNKPIVYITVMNNISLDCDCDANQGDPIIGDIGIIASLDPVANDQAFIDFIWNSNDPHKDELIARVDGQVGRHITEYAEEIGLGTTDYELIEI